MIWKVIFPVFLWKNVVFYFGRSWSPCDWAMRWREMIACVGKKTRRNYLIIATLHNTRKKSTYIVIDLKNLRKSIWKKKKKIYLLNIFTPKIWKQNWDKRISHLGFRCETRQTEDEEWLTTKSSNKYNEGGTRAISRTGSIVISPKSDVLALSCIEQTAPRAATQLKTSLEPKIRPWSSHEKKKYSKTDRRFNELCFNYACEQIAIVCLVLNPASTLKSLKRL